MSEAAQPAILVVSVEVDEADVDELNRWYEAEHGPERLAMPGFVAMRRFRAYDGSPRFLAVYELESADAATSPAYMSAPQSDWMREILAKWKRWDRDVWVELPRAPDPSTDQ